MAFFRKGKEREVETPRLVIRRWEMDDLPDLVAFGADPRVALPAGSVVLASQAEAEAELRRMVRDSQCFAIVLKERGRAIGKLRFQRDAHRMNHPGSLSVGYQLAWEHWGRGYMTEALGAMMEVAFRDLRADVLGVSHFAGNERSRRVIEKCGFRYEGRLARAYRRYDGAVFDDDCYSLTREEYFRKENPERQGRL